MVIVSINLLVIFAIIFFYYFKAKKKPLQEFFLPGIILKCLAGISVGLIYKYYYGGGDTFNYYHDAIAFSEFALKSPIYYLSLILKKNVPYELHDLFIYSDQPRALVTAKILSFFALITQNNYWISGLYLSLFSFFGMWYLANKLVEKYPGTKWAAALGFLLFPSVLFWSSGILKESMIMGSLSFLFGFFIGNLPGMKNNLSKNSLWIILFFLIMWQLKYYYLAVFISVSLTTILILYFNHKFSKQNLKPYITIIIWMIVFLFLLGASTFLYPTLHINNILYFLLYSHDIIYSNSSSENLIHYYNLNADFISFFRNLPIALFAGLFRPGIWDVNPFIQWIPAIENLFILVSSVLILKNLRKPYSTTNLVLVFALIIYILMIAVLMAFAAPNFGTLMRYKIGFLPFLVYLICIDNPLLKFFKKSGT